MACDPADPDCCLNHRWSPAPVAVPACVSTPRVVRLTRDGVSVIADLDKLVRRGLLSPDLADRVFADAAFAVAPPPAPVEPPRASTLPLGTLAGALYVAGAEFANQIAFMSDPDRALGLVPVIPADIAAFIAPWVERMHKAAEEYLAGGPVCPGVEIEPGAFSGCDAAETGATDCPTCAPREPGQVASRTE